jgi:L-malate glycosyltransferase
MRILQISSARSFGGGEKHLIDLTGGLAAKGHEVFLAAALDSPLRDRTPVSTAISFVPLKIGHALDIAAALSISKIIREKNIDVVHAHVARDYIPASLAVRLNPKAKLVLTRHVLFPMKRLQKFALSNVLRVIAVSSAVRSQLRRQNTFPPEKVITISNGINTAHWADAPGEELRKSFRETYNIPLDAFLIGSVGELKKLKGQEDLTLAAEMVLQKFPDTYFVIVGKDNSSDGEYGRHLRNLAAAIGAADKFIWIDWIEDTAPLLHALDVFVSPSHSESFGLAILEAMASGCAVVSTETEGAKELFGKASLVPVEDPLKLAAAICSVLEDSFLRETLGKDLQIRAVENFDLKRMIEATEKLYLEL